MDLSFSAADEAFRLDVRDFFENRYPKDILDKLQRGQTLGKGDLVRSEKALNDQGWVAVNWPKEYGGTGWTVTQKYIFDEELQRAGAQSVVPMGLLYVAPVIYTFGSEAQKKRFLPDILSSDVFWAQGYSEPEAGSDLASLRTRADLDGDDYIVNGTKIWTSQAHYADWIFCLVRTDNSGKPQEGITFLCMDMNTPGITVHPIITIDGGHHLNQVEFVDVRVPVENRIGEAGQGWTYAKYLLTHERTSYAHVARKKMDIARLKKLARGIEAGGMTLAENPQFQVKVADAEVALASLEMTALRALSSLSTGQAPGKESSVLKIMATEQAQAITELFLDLGGYYSAQFIADRSRPDWNANTGIPDFCAPSTAAYFFNRAQTIYGGSTEIQKNVIAKQALELDQ
ncbi:MAG: acyl-CoA dehydrogenase family protein [Alphaproteobacteria bacterium]